MHGTTLITEPHEAPDEPHRRSAEVVPGAEPLHIDLPSVLVEGGEDCGADGRIGDVLVKQSQPASNEAK